MSLSKLQLTIPCLKKELHLNITLQCGQSFRWLEIGPGKWRGMIKDDLWTLTQDDTNLQCLLHNYDANALIKIDHTLSDYSKDVIQPSKAKKLKKNDGEATIKTESNNTLKKRSSRTNVDSEKKNSKIFDSSSIPPHKLEYYTQMIRNYFRLDISLENLYSTWSTKDANFARVAPTFPGVRMLDQPIVENVFSFILSSNNNIARIGQLVEKLCVNYGNVICSVDEKTWYSFPTIESLCQSDVEEQLRSLAFGYRAAYISRSAALILKNGGVTWLDSLRHLPYGECHNQLCTLPGVGKKVADCICLMSMNHLDTIPVDTHVFQIAARDYLPELRSVKTVTDGVYRKIAQHFRELYGDHAGWAHSVLFSADLQKFSARKKKSPVRKFKKLQ